MGGGRVMEEGRWKKGTRDRDGRMKREGKWKGMIKMKEGRWKKGTCQN